MLSRPPSEDKGEKDNADLTLLPPQIFVRTADLPWDRLLQDVNEAQNRHRSLMEDWKQSKEVTQDDQGMYMRDGKIVIPPDESLKRQILRRNHDTPTRGHPGRDRTIDLLERLGNGTGTPAGARGPPRTLSRPGPDPERAGFYPVGLPG